VSVEEIFRFSEAQLRKLRKQDPDWEKKYRLTPVDAEFVLKD